MSDDEEIRRNIENGNFCGRDYYVDNMEDSDNIVDSCKPCPPGNENWYVQGPPPRLLKRIDNPEMDQLIQCSGGDTVSTEFLLTLDPNFDERGAMGVPTWKEKQQSANIKKCKLDPVTGTVDNNETCKSVQQDYSQSIDDEDNLNAYFRNYNLFEECVRAKGRDMKGMGEYSLVNQLTKVSKSTIDNCLETLPPINICDIGYSDMFLSVPELIIEEGGYGKLKPEDIGTFDRTSRQIIRYAYNDELNICGDVSDTTKSLYNISNKKSEIKFDNLGSLWPDNKAGFGDYITIFLRWAIISLVLYWFVKIIK